MSEPTQYDLVQDSRLDTVEGLVQTTYQPFQGPEFSYPVVHQPMDDEMWQQVTLGVGSGLLDVGGRPYWLRDLSDVTDTGKLTVSTTTGTAQAILRGFYHRLNQDLTLSFPPVSQKTVYQVVLEYDPLRHKEPGGPIRVRVLTSLDWSGGKHYLPLWDVERNPSQLLSDAVVVQKRPKISPQIHVDYPESMPDPRTQLWGATCYIRYGDEAGVTYVAAGESEETGGPTRWDSQDNPPWKRMGIHSSNEHAPRPWEYRFNSGFLEFRGGVRRKSGNFPTNATTAGWTSRDVKLPPFVISAAGDAGVVFTLATIPGGSGNTDIQAQGSEASSRYIWFDGIRIPLS